MTTRTNHTITAEEDGMRLDRLVHKRYGMPNSLCQKSCRKGLIRLNTKRVEASSRVAEGDVLELRMGLEPSATPVARKRAGKTLSDRDAAFAQSLVIYKDKQILVLNKPSGLAVQGGSKISKHIDGLLPALQFDAAEPPRLVHRIDKDTSGLLILARTLQAARELQHIFAQKLLQKTYLALITGVLHPLSGTIESRLIKAADDDDFEKVKTVNASKDAGKKAITEYAVRDYMHKTASLVELRPITGRTHQLRVHMAERDCPIVGDRKYAMRGEAAHLNIDTSRLHLHAWRLELPAFAGSKKPLRFEAPLPDIMQKNLAELGLSL